MNLKGKRVLVYGLSKTGIAVLEFLKNRQAIIYVFDDKISVSNFIDNKIVLPFNPFLIENGYIDLIVISPGVPLLNNDLIISAKKHKIKIVSEIELAYQFCKSKNIIGVTGTNGKTTVTELIYSILNKKYKCYKCGNIGIPFISIVDKIEKSDYIVIELSSFQLETIKKFRPKISVILNLAPDHLNRYKSVDEYYNTKLSIYKNQKLTDYCIINDDDKNTKRLMKKCKAKVIKFSLKNKNCDAYIKNNSFMLKDGNKEFVISFVKDVKLKGEHNQKNLLVGILVGNLLKVELTNIQNVIENFCALEHRLEFVKNIDGVEYVNDSKATNIDATKQALTSFKDERVHLLLGGSDKGENFEDLFANLSDNIICYIYGNTKDKMIQSALNSGYSNYIVHNKLSDALNDAKSKAKAGDIVLLSPACASFDEFDNFEMRGKFFKEWVNKNV
ncbi:MAG: UDP-N-acetylmuramoyl-L-alanine--D-glutamate ligase [Christensenellales bacterium]